MPVRLDTSSADFGPLFKQFLAAKREVSADVERATRAIVDDVAARGDTALLEATKKFDRLDTDASGLRVTAAEVDAAVGACDTATLDALNRATGSGVSPAAMPKDECFTDALGVNSAGAGARSMRSASTPGGTAAYPSSVLMNAVGGVPACRGSSWWCLPRRQPNPLVLAAAQRRRLRDLSRRRRAGGGGAGVWRCHHRAGRKIVGPGNAYVAAAKRQVFGKVGIDMIAGPRKCSSSPTIPATPAGSPTAGAAEG